MTIYTIDSNPPPVAPHPKKIGKPKGNLRIALEKMKPGDGMFVPDRKSGEIGGWLYPIKKETGHLYISRSQGDGCYVWCLAAPVQP